ncbi:MAG: pyruvate kinase [Candidatus Rhabdochlamydia sp.]
MKQTKMICTIGPSCNSYDQIVRLIQSGMDVARINLSHGSYEEHAHVIQLIKKARETLQVQLAIMVDTKGPEIRVGEIEGGGRNLSNNLVLELVKERKTTGQIEIHPPNVIDRVKDGMPIFFDDGSLEGKIIHHTQDHIQVKMVRPGFLKSHKSVTIPQMQRSQQLMTEQDQKDLLFASHHGVEWIAASFIQSVDHILQMRSFLLDHGKSSILIMAKIECLEAVEQFKDILAHSDGIMVARGDLGVELPLEEVPSLQKMMTKACQFIPKPIVIATQMLESMTVHARPTRAEVSDVANAIYDHASAVMLSAETAVGDYPLESASMMKQIILQIEKELSQEIYTPSSCRKELLNAQASIALAAVDVAHQMKAEGIVVFTLTGASARLISSFRPRVPIIAVTISEKVYHELSLEWGVIGVKVHASASFTEALQCAFDFALARNLLKKGSSVITTAGEPFWIEGSTDRLTIESIPL